ncbi:MAG: TrkH family potassium uptake protein [Bacteroidales bacterium]|nr:TrkH family potassium uptake protein [Bacteroidales bacterium]MCF8458286.1 TrkH family potassium uptake protein [Bacteroidales bacterium]
MRYEIVLKYLGIILLFNAFFLFIAFIISIFMVESSAIPLLFSSFLCLVIGFFPMLFVEPISDITFSEGIYIVVIGWLSTCLVGMLPYIMWGGEFTLVNAWFESVSGFTTTGSTILSDIETLPKGLLFWRSATHWMGGIGVIMFVLFILPNSQNPRLKLLNTEISELSKTSYKYRAKQIISILAFVYIGLTLVETLLLWAAGMSFFDAINHAFATIATGGFSTKNMSIAYFNNFNIELIIVVFMILSGIHFGLLFNTLTGRPNNIFQSKIVRAYLVILMIGVMLVALKLFLNGNYDLATSFRSALFQVVSLGTTTGFATEDTAIWPVFTQIILIYFTIQCAMAGSTSGGLKFDRVFIFIKSVKKQINLIQHPRAVIALKIDKRIINETLENQVLGFIVLYIFTLFISTVLLTFFDVGLYTAFSASVATLGNVGPGFENVSSLGNFASLPDMAKIILSADMLLGRLEIFSIIIFLSIRRNRI